MINCYGYYANITPYSQPQTVAALEVLHLLHLLRPRAHHARDARMQTHTQNKSSRMCAPTRNTCNSSNSKGLGVVQGVTVPVILPSTRNSGVFSMADSRFMEVIL